MSDGRMIDIAELARKAAQREPMSPEELSAWINIITREVYDIQDRLDKLERPND